MVQQDNTVWTQQKTQDKIIFTNLTLKLRKLNGNTGMYFFPEFLYNYIQSLTTNSRIFTFTLSTDSAFSLQIYKILKGHIGISLVLAHCLSAHFEKP